MPRQNDLDKALSQDVRDRNRDVLLSMWSAAKADPTACMVHFDASLSTVQQLARMTQSQVVRVASIDEFLFTPRFDADRLARLAGQADDGTPRLSPDAEAAAYCMVPPKA